MDKPRDSSPTADEQPDLGGLDAGLAAAFGPMPAPGGVLAALTDSYGPLRPVLLQDAAAEGSDVVVRAGPAELPPGAGGRYQLFGEIARGGMGAVLRGRDPDLNRDVAVKVLLDKHAGRPDVVRRFVEEAQVGAQLQHPGVVPVY